MSRLNRREFLGVASAAAGVIAASSTGRQLPLLEAAVGENLAMVPDTLDLADRARIAVNGLTGILDPKLNYMCYHAAYFDTQPATMDHIDVPPFACLTGDELWGKQVEALTKMRLMSGSEQKKEYDRSSIDGMIACTGNDNLWWKHVARGPGIAYVNRPSKSSEMMPSPADDNVPLYAQARVMLALVLQHNLEGDPRLLKEAERLRKGLESQVIYKADYAYYPDSTVGGTLCVPRGGWPSKAEPAGWSMCGNDWHFSSSCVEFAQGGIVRAFCRLYETTGDESALAFAGKLVRFMLQPRMWQPLAKPQAVMTEGHAWFDGHMHAYCWGLWGLLDYANLTNDARIKAFVRDGYQYIRTLGGVPRLGLFGETCAVGDMTNLAIRLSDVGVGDYWEDVDQYVRNHLVEIQQLDAGILTQLTNASSAAQVNPWQTQDNVIQRNIGVLAADATHTTFFTPGGIYCCTCNGLIAYYHAWKSIVQQDGDTVRVNLMLNRRSPWVDVESSLPYEGKVVLRNKTAKSLCVRISDWIDRNVVKYAVQGEASAPFWMNGYLIFNGVSSNGVITITFPVVEATESHTNLFEGALHGPGHTEVTCMAPRAEGVAYSCRFRGNTLVDISPRLNGEGYPIYERNALQKSGPAPIKKQSSYVATKFV